MPLYKSLTLDNDTQVLVWKNTESLEQLRADTRLKEVCQNRLEGMKSEQHQKGFLGVRMLLQHVGYTDFDLFYDANGKPHLKDGKNISITHSYAFSAIIISSRQIGIDMELQREKVVLIANKFVDAEFSYLSPEDNGDYLRRLIIIWGVKEAVYKMISRPGMSFKQNIEVFPFNADDGQGETFYNFEGVSAKVPFYFMELEGFTLVYCLGL
ncbi:MAG: 4'-phosphopantetheinyl transferase family protein [Bacteroidia bacterium]